MKALYKFETVAVFQAVQVGGFIILICFSLLTEKSSKIHYDSIYIYCLLPK